MISATAKSQENSKLIVGLIEQANTKELAKYFNKRVDITINQSENNYSIEQAEVILKNFLTGLASKQVILVQNGKSDDNTQFIIASLVSKTSKYKTYILFKNTSKGYLIHDIRFEKE